MPSCVPSLEMITGLNITRGIFTRALNAFTSSLSSQLAGTSITHTLSQRPTCCAASPTPFAWYIVWSMLSARRTSSGVTAGTGTAFSRSTADPYLTISSNIRLRR